MWRRACRRCAARGPLRIEPCVRRRAQPFGRLLRGRRRTLAQEHCATGAGLSVDSGCDGERHRRPIGQGDGGAEPDGLDDHGGGWWWSSAPSGSPDAERAKMASAAEAVRSVSSRRGVAVLPFINLSGDPSQEYFSDGLTEDVIAAIGRFGSLTVM